MIKPGQCRFLLVPVAALGLALAMSAPALAVDATPVDVQRPSAATATKPATESKSTRKSTKKKAKEKSDRRSHLLFFEGYKAAHGMIYRDADYQGGIARLRALGQDNHPDVANLIGFSSRKLGRYDDARHWYEKALAADPKHALTWSYYGMWHAEQGNMLKARDHLAKVQGLCGTKCREYVMLNGVIEGTRVY
jgi:tetratricopeptide (TPR) repeat protein